MEVIIPNGFETLMASDRDGILGEMIHLLVRCGRLAPESEIALVQALRRREEFGSTAVTNHVAIPHVRHDGVGNKLICALGRSNKGIHYDTGVGNRTHLFFLVLSSKEMIEYHLECLATITHLVRDEKLVLDMICEQSTRKLKNILAGLEGAAHVQRRSID